MIKPKIRKTAILLFRHHGHYMHYARLLYQSFSEFSEVTFVLPGSVRSSEEFQMEFAGELEKIKLLTTEKGEVPFLFEHVKRKDFDIIFSNALDRYWIKIIPGLLLLKLSGKLKTLPEGILVSAGFSYPENKKQSLKRLRCFLLRRLVPLIFRKFYLIDEIAYSVLFPEGNGVCHLLNDPVEDFPERSRESLRKDFGWSSEWRILLAVGVMIPEKRVDLLVKAFLDSSLTAERRLVLAGKFSSSVLTEVRDIIEKSPYKNQVLLINRWLENGELNGMIKAADYISVTYPEHFSNASILFRAIKAKKFALVSNDGWISKYAEKYHCGVMADIFSGSDYSRAIDNLFHINSALKTDWSAAEHSETAFLEKIRAVH